MNIDKAPVSANTDIIPCFASIDKDQDTNDDAGQCDRHSYDDAGHGFLIQLVEAIGELCKFQADAKPINKASKNDSRRENRILKTANVNRVRKRCPDLQLLLSCQGASSCNPTRNLQGARAAPRRWKRALLPTD